MNTSGLVLIGELDGALDAIFVRAVLALFVGLAVFFTVCLVIGVLVSLYLSYREKDQYDVRRK